MKDHLLKNEKLMQAQEEKVQILVDICTSLPAITEKATLLWAARVPDPDAAITAGAATNSSEEPGTSTGGDLPGSQDLHGGSSTTTSPDNPRLSAPLDLQADCLIASDLDLMSEAEVGRESDSSSERELNKVCPPPSNFQDTSHNPSMRVVHLTDFIHGWDIPLDLCPDHENFKRTEGGASSKDCNCLAESCWRHFTNKEAAHSHICTVHSFMGLLAPGSGLMAAAYILTISEMGSIHEAPWQHPFCWSGNVLWMWGFKGWVVLISTNIGSVDN